MKKAFKSISSILALTMMTTALSGCGEKEVKTNADPGSIEEEVTLTWYAPFGMHPDNELVFEMASDYVKEKINANVDVVLASGGNYDQKMQVINASGEEYDIAFTSNWSNNYYDNVNKGVFLELDDLMEKYAPKLKAIMPDSIWDGVRVNGKIYGVINQQILARGASLVLHKPTAEAIGADINSYKKITDLTSYLEKVKEVTGKRNEILLRWQPYAQVAGLEEFMGTGLPAAIYYENNDDIKVVNQYKTPEFQEYCKTVYQWSQDGLIQEAAIFEGEDFNKRAAQITDTISPYNSFLIDPAYKPGIERECQNKYKHEVIVAQMSKPLLTSYGVTAALNGISSTSKHPERAMMFLELLNTDPYLFNLYYRGIEGRHYTVNEQGRYVPIEGNEYGAAYWAIGNAYNGLLSEEDDADMWEKTKEINETADISPIYGFSPDLTPISVEVSNCKSVTNEFLGTLQQGVVDYDKIYPQFIQKLEAAGADRVIEEMQKQIDEWLKNNK